MNKVQEAREKKNLTVVQLAISAKTSPQTIYGIERKGRLPRRGLRARIAQALGVSMSELFGDGKSSRKDG